MENEVIRKKLWRRGYYLWRENTSYFVCRREDFCYSHLKRGYKFYIDTDNELFSDRICKKVIEFIDSGEFLKYYLAWKMK